MSTPNSSAEPSRRMLVPIVDGDITERVFARVRALVGCPNARLVLLHVAPEPGRTDRSGRAAPQPADVTARRWRRLAAAWPPGRVHVGVTPSGSAADLRAEADRFGCDSVVDDAVRDEAAPLADAVVRRPPISELQVTGRPFAPPRRAVAASPARALAEAH